MPKPYALLPEKRETYSILFLLNYLQNVGHIPVILLGDDTLLDGLLTKAYDQHLIEINGLLYEASAKGLASLALFMRRYSDFLMSFDVYHSVDLRTGEFGMSKFWDLDEEAYAIYLQEDRWEDLRIAVAEYKKIDPVEIVFMSFLSEGRFDTEKKGWQFELALGTAWDEIVNLCSTNLQPQDLGYEGVPWENVIRDVIEQGAALMVALLQKEHELNTAAGRPQNVDSDVYTIRTVYTVDYWDDPFYVYDFWYDPYW